MKKLELTIKKVEGKLNLSIKIPKELEKIFKTLSGNATSESTMWLIADNGGAKFYKETSEYSQVTKILQASAYDTNYYFNDFGASLLLNNKVNIAPLRIAGASDGVTITSAKFETMTGVNIEHYIRQLAEAAKKIWESFVSETEVKAVITFEL